MFQQVPLVKELGCERGLHLVRYGGGSEFREAKSLFHYAATRVSSGDGSIGRESLLDIRRRVEDAYAARSDDEQQYYPLPSLRDIHWENLSWDFAVHVSTPVCLGKGFEHMSNPQRQKTNLFHHGWLFGDPQIRNKIAYPLIGIVQVEEDGCIVEEPGDKDFCPQASVPFLSKGEVLKAFDQHIHRIDPLAGGGVEDYVSLLVQYGIAPEDASVFAKTELAAANDFYQGSDMARILVQTQEGVLFTSALVLCVDLQDPSVPRVLFTLLIIAMTPEAESKATSFSNSLTDSSGEISPVSWNTLQSKLIDELFQTHTPSTLDRLNRIISCDCD